MAHEHPDPELPVPGLGDLSLGGGFSRRRFLSLAVASAAASAMRCPLAETLSFRSDPFTLGVASGDPLSDRVILWTRLAPDPLNGGGMPDEAVPVVWEVANDPDFQVVVRSGLAVAAPSLGHSVHVDVPQLQPDQWYWYRFHAGTRTSPVGRTRTLPAPDAAPGLLRFAAASCQHWESGFYTAHAALAQEDVDLVFFLGDYIYEGGMGSSGVRQHDGPRLSTLESFRNRYALYKGDANLQASHAAFPWIVTWDDHEVSNNYAGLKQDEHQTQVDFVALRTAAYRAYYEHMPIRVGPPKTEFYEIRREFRFGDLATFFVADTRQYRTDQRCNDFPGPPCAEIGDPSDTLLGAAQEAWLFDRMRASPAIWNVLAQQIVYTPTVFELLGGSILNPDQWDGYPVERQRINDFVVQNGIQNFVVLTGDIHVSGAAYISQVATDAETPVIGAEFVATGITSTGLDLPLEDPAEAGLHHVRYFNGGPRGYFRCEVTRDSWQTDFRLVETTQQPVSPVFTDASFRITPGNLDPQRIT